MMREGGGGTKNLNKLNYLIANASIKAFVKINCKENENQKKDEYGIAKSNVNSGTYTHFEKTKTKRNTRKIEEENKHNTNRINTIRSGVTVCCLVIFSLPFGH